MSFSVQSSNSFKLTAWRFAEKSTNAFANLGVALFILSPLVELASRKAFKRNYVAWGLFIMIFATSWNQRIKTITRPFSEERLSKVIPFLTHQQLAFIASARIEVFERNKRELQDRLTSGEMSVQIEKHMVIFRNVAANIFLRRGITFNESVSPKLTEEGTKRLKQEKIMQIAALLIVLPGLTVPQGRLREFRAAITT